MSEREESWMALLAVLFLLVGATVFTAGVGRWSLVLFVTGSKPQGITLFGALLLAWWWACLRLSR
jgi:hypothetical protein